MGNPKRGTVFTHKHMLALEQGYWVPISHNSPKAECRVTCVRKGFVYYTYNDGSAKGSWWTPLETWLADYGTAK